MPFAYVAIDRFELVKYPSKKQKPAWESPYRLLGGAAFSIAQARISEKKAAHHKMPNDLPMGWWDVVKRQVLTGGNQDTTAGWVHIWHASYMLTNAIFRIGAATEKILGIAIGKPGQGRLAFGQLHDSKGPLSRKLTSAHKHLKMLPIAKARETTHAMRATFLAASRATYGSGTLGSALACAICQTDIDKHVPYTPLKQLGFDFAVAEDGLSQAGDIFEQAIQVFDPI